MLLQITEAAWSVSTLSNTLLSGRMAGGYPRGEGMDSTLEGILSQEERGSLIHIVWGKERKKYQKPLQRNEAGMIQQVITDPSKGCGLQGKKLW